MKGLVIFIATLQFFFTHGEITISDFLLKNFTFNTTLAPPILIEKRLINLKNNCRNNPLLVILPIGSQLNDTLYTDPSPHEGDYCKFNGAESLTCCSYDSFIFLRTYFQDDFIPNKIKIYLNNVRNFYLIYKEHLRNFVKGFGFNQTQFEFLFESYDTIVKELTKSTESILKNSVQYTWNSFCNYICNIPSIPLCRYYNLTYDYSNSTHYDIEVECDVDHVMEGILKDETKIFLSKLVSIDVDKIYQDVFEKLNQVIHTNPTTVAIFTEELKFSQLNNSLIAGLNVSKDIHKLPCLTMESESNKTKCLSQFKEFCFPFECNENFFLEFYKKELDMVMMIPKETKNKTVPKLSFENKNLKNFPDDIKDLLSLIELKGNFLSVSITLIVLLLLLFL